MGATATAVRVECPERSARLGWAAGAAFVALDALVVLAAGAAAVLLRYLFGAPYDPLFYLKLAPLALLFPVTQAVAGAYPVTGLNPVKELRAVVRSTTVFFLLLSGLSFFQRDAEDYSRAVLILAWGFASAALPLARAAVRGALGQTSWWGARTVIVGAGPIGRQVAQSLISKPALGLRVVGFLDDSPQAGAVPVLGGLDRAPLLSGQNGITYAIIAMPGAPGRKLAEAVERYFVGYRHVLVIPDVGGIASLETEAGDVGGVLALDVSHRLLDPLPRFVKRLMDLVLAVGGGLLLLPLFGLLCLLVRRSSPGPIFYPSRRVGSDGRLFHAWKFRTMVNDGDEVLRKLLDANPGFESAWRFEKKIKNDPRVTWIGRILRRTSLDELPQLWNVIRGDMSLVGPRPILESEVSRYGSRYQLYKRVRPGLTGLWQVSGRNNTTYQQRLAYVEYYIRNWSVWLDLWILAKTFRAVLKGDGAY